MNLFPIYIYIYVLLLVKPQLFSLLMEADIIFYLEGCFSCWSIPVDMYLDYHLWVWVDVVVYSQSVSSHCINDRNWCWGIIHWMLADDVSTSESNWKYITCIQNVNIKLSIGILLWSSKEKADSNFFCANDKVLFVETLMNRLTTSILNI